MAAGILLASFFRDNRPGYIGARMIPKSGNRFLAFAKPVSAGEARSDKIMRK
jgi:hypothetical protein